MKKFIFVVITVVAAFCLASCAGAPVQTVKNIDPDVVANKSYDMTLEKAAGEYTLSSMDILSEVSEKSYTENKIQLTADGNFILTVKVASEEVGDVNKTGSYEIAPDGVISFFLQENEGFFIAAKDETVVCNGNKLSAEGKLGNVNITMNYSRIEKNEVSEQTQDPTATGDLS